MKILVIHNRHRYPGGEEVVVDQEIGLLRSKGHEVITYFRSNEELDRGGLFHRARAGYRSIWAADSVSSVNRLIRDGKPDLVHLHNVHVVVSPAVIACCDKHRVPMVATLHNYRLACLAGTLFRSGQTCETCIRKRFLWPGVLHGCFNGKAASAALATGHWLHGLAVTWDRVRRFVAPTAFLRDKMVEAGLDAGKVRVKPHFVPDRFAAGVNSRPKNGDLGIAEKGRPYMVYVGRLSPEKGILSLLRAWESMPQVPLRIFGEGPLEGELRAFLSARPELNIELFGTVSRERLRDAIRGAVALVFPSQCYEAFGMTIIEAFALGTPVIASGHGAPRELVEAAGGPVFAPGDGADLRDKVLALWHSPESRRALGAAARKSYEDRYGAEDNYSTMMAIYGEALAR